jgi:hypothetical protein
MYQFLIKSLYDVYEGCKVAKFNKKSTINYNRMIILYIFEMENY